LVELELDVASTARDGDNSTFTFHRCGRERNDTVWTHQWLRKRPSRQGAGSLELWHSNAKTPKKESDATAVAASE